MIGILEPVAACFALNDPTDPRHQYVTALRTRFGKFLHKASQSLRQQGEENTVDAVMMLVGCQRYNLLTFTDDVLGKRCSHIHDVLRG